MEKIELVIEQINNILTEGINEKPIDRLYKNGMFKFQKRPEYYALVYYCDALPEGYAIIKETTSYENIINTIFKILLYSDERMIDVIEKRTNAETLS